MERKAKRLVTAVLALLLIAGIGVFYFVNQLDRIIAEYIETEGGIATGTDVRVSGVSIRLADANARIAGLTIGNPMELGGNAFELGEFSIDLDAASLASDVIILDSIGIQGARLNVFQDGATNNLVHLQRSISRSLGDSESAGQRSGKRAFVREFVLSGATVYVSIPELRKEEQYDIPDIVLVDIGNESTGETGAEITRQLLTPIVEQALRLAADEYLQDQVDQQLENAAESLLDGLREQLESEHQTEQ